MLVKYDQLFSKVTYKKHFDILKYYDILNRQLCAHLEKITLVVCWKKNNLLSLQWNDENYFFSPVK